jgi:hypothetical protein
VKQKRLKYPELIEIVQMENPAGGFDVYCDFSDGDVDRLDAGPRGIVITGDGEFPVHYHRGLRAAFNAATRQYGRRVRIELSRAPRRGHRPHLVLRA